MSNSWPPGGSRLAVKSGVVGQVILGFSGAHNTWLQATASSTEEYYLASWAVADINGVSASGATEIVIEVATGASGSEFTIANGVIFPGPASGSVFYAGQGQFGAPIRIPAGTRIAARAQVPSATTLLGRLLLVPYANVEGS